VLWYDRVDLGVLFRVGVCSLYRCELDMRCGGVVSSWMARTEEGLRKGERVLLGVQGETWLSKLQEGARVEGRSEMSSSEVWGDSCWDRSWRLSKTSSSGPLELRAESWSSSSEKPIW